MTILITSNEEIVDIIKIVKSFDDFGLSINGVTKRIENEPKEQKGGFLGILLSTLENLLADERVTTRPLDLSRRKSRRRRGVIRASKKTISVGPDF